MKYYPKDYTLTREGDVDQTLYILISGKIGIFKGDIKIAEFERKGTIVGEMSVILKEARSATIKTLEESHIAVINANLKELVEKHTDVTQKILKNLAERLNKTTKDYWKLAERVNYLADVNIV